MKRMKKVKADKTNEYFSIESLALQVPDNFQY